MMKAGNTQTRDGFDIDDGNAKKINTLEMIIFVFIDFLPFILFITDRLSFCMLFGKTIVHVLQIIVLSNKM